jgi:hypothetical protein
MTANITPQYTHLYYTWYRCWDGCPPNSDGRGILAGHSCYEVVACPVTRITAKRIYFTTHGSTSRINAREHFVDRAAIERDGDAYHREIGERLMLNPPTGNDRLQQPTVIAELRREMANCHPDVGGDPAEFRVAYARYAAAKAVSR